jgi:hypothetical protein
METKNLVITEEKGDEFIETSFTDSETYLHFVNRIKDNLLKINENDPDRVAVMIFADGKCVDIADWVADSNI